MTARTTVVGPDVATARQASRDRHPTARPRRRPQRPPAPPQFFALAFLVALLTLFGLVMVLSASAITAIHAGRSGWTFFMKQTTWATLGAMALFIGLRFPLRLVRRLVPLGLLVTFGLLVAVLVPGLGSRVNGARAWFVLGPFALQPAEIAKLVLVVYCADLFARRADRMHEVRSTLWPAMLMLGLMGVLVMLQPDLGTVIVLAAIVLALAFIGGSPLIPLAGTVGAVGLAGAAFTLSAQYRRARWLAFLDLAKNKDDKGFQVWQSLVGIASGGVTGVGLGASKAKWDYLPEAHTDFIFAIIAEELGLIGVIVVVLLFVLLGLFGAQVALRAQDRFGMLLAGGITAWLMVQAIINIGGVVGIMPLTGLTLPFLSFGGSSLVVTMTAAGLLLNVARTATR